MDPLSTSIGLLASVAQLSVYITRFVRGVRDARQDMDAVSRELKSLELCLETLREDFADPKMQYPARARQMLLAIMQDCDVVTKKMLALLTMLAPDNFGTGVRWTTGASSEMNKLRSSLAAHKSAIDIALEMWTLSIAAATKDDTTAIRRCTDDIKQDTEALIEEVQMLRLQVEGLGKDGTTGNLNRFLDLTEESIVEKGDVEGETDEKSRELSTINEERHPSSHKVEDCGPRSVITRSSQGDPTRMHANWGGIFDGLDRSPRTVPSLITGYAEQTGTPLLETSTPVTAERATAYTQNSWITRQLIAGESLSENPISTYLSSPRDHPQIVTEKSIHQVLSDGNEKEVISTSNSSRKSNVTSNASLPEVSCRNQPRHLSLDEVAITASTKNRGRLKDRERNQLDLELLKRIKEKVDITKISSLLDRGANPDASGPRNTVLTTEIQYGGRYQVIELLLQRGANPNATTDGVPAYEILEGGNMDRAKSLFRVGTSVDAVPNRVGILYLAALHGTIDLVSLLLAYNATVNPSYLETRSPVLRNRSNEYSLSPSNPDRRGSVTTRQMGSHKSAVLAAAEANKWEIVNVLCEEGADPNVRGLKDDTTILQLAAAAGKKDIIIRLFESGADVTAQGGYYGSPLIAAACEGHSGIVKLLLDRGAAAMINTRGCLFGTALAAAVVRGHVKVVNLLLERGADTKIDHVLDIALQCVKDEPDVREREVIVRSLERQGARQAPKAPKAPEYPGLF